MIGEGKIANYREYVNGCENFAKLKIARASCMFNHYLKNLSCDNSRPSITCDKKTQAQCSDNALPLLSCYIAWHDKSSARRAIEDQSLAAKRFNITSRY